MRQPTVGTTLRGARRSLSISVATASKRAGVSPSTVKRWEAGSGLPSGTELQGYFDFIGLPSDSSWRSACHSSDVRPQEEPRQRPLMRVIRAKRRRQMMTLADLSDATGLSVASLHRYETGERSPDPENLPILLRAYGCGAEEIELVCQGSTKEEDGPLIEKFLEQGRNPHFWVYHRLEQATDGKLLLSADQAVDLVHGLMIMGDHRAVLEAWALVKGAVQQVELSRERRAEISLSLTLARITVLRDRSRAFDRMGRWREYAAQLPPGPDSFRSMSHLARVAAALGEVSEAESWLARLQAQAEHIEDCGILFLCALNRLMLEFGKRPELRHLGDLEEVRERARGPLQAYTCDVARLYMADTLGESSMAEALLRHCTDEEGTYGFGSPLAMRIRQKRRAAVS